jgi:hypothetical protein
MKRFVFALLIFSAGLVTPAKADWRWHPPKLKKQKIVFHCGSMACISSTYKKAKHIYKLRVERYNKRRLAEWKRWIAIPIPDCTWYGESGTGPEYSPTRYTTPNSTGSGAYGKFQMMPATYKSRGKYDDWSPLDQEIAARREFRVHGTSPWANCTG